MTFDKLIANDPKLSTAKIETIYFDMDGTIADLFGQPNWLNRLRSNDWKVYEECRPLYSENEFKKIKQIADMLGAKIGIISWGSMEATAEENRAIKKSKVAWLKKYFPYATEIHIVKYGTPKSKVAKNHNSILVDDSRANREEWKWGTTINAYRNNIVKELEKLRRS